MGTKVRLWMITTALAVSLAIFTISARAATTASVRLAGNPSTVDLAAAGVTSALPSSSKLSMRAVMALRNQAELDQLIEDLQDPASVDYHRWLTPDEFTARFGPTPEDLTKVSAWLTAQGFTVTSAKASDRLVRFSGSAARASATFQVRMAASADGHYFANLDSPAIPANLAGVIQSVQGLDNLYGPVVAPYTATTVPGPKGDAFGPTDMYSFYDETPLLTASVNGTGADCIALPEYSDFDDASVAAFDTFFNLPALNDGTTLVRVAVDGASSILPGSNVEALLDVEYSHAAAPQTPIRVYIATSEAANLGFIDSVQQAVTDNTCGSISLSIGVCPENADFANSADAIYQQASTQGQTIFAAAGDDGSESLALKPKTGSCGPSGKRGVIETAASPNVTSIGGTMSKVKFDDNGIAIAGSAPETVWHEKIGAGGGGKSAFFAKPTYQNGFTPKDSKRDIPDISLLAAQLTPGYIIGVNSAVQCCAGGTSFASPYWAGIGALMEQLNGGRLGTLNTQLYSLAKTDAEANGIHDVLKGNNGFKGVAGFAAKKGYDQASGWGTPDISVFAHAYTVK